jgi:hypothetical protein
MPRLPSLPSKAAAAGLRGLGQAARQWPFDELRGEGGGALVSAVLEVERTRPGLLRLLSGAGMPSKVRSDVIAQWAVRRAAAGP